MIRYVLMFLASLLVISVAILRFCFADLATIGLRMEIAKALLQLGVVAVAGALVSLLVFEYQREAQLRDKQREADRQQAEKLRETEREDAAKQREIDRQKTEKDRDIERLQQEKAKEVDRQNEQKARDERTRRAEYVEELHVMVLTKALAGYGEMKKVRRLLRARSIRRVGDIDYLNAARYDEYMDRINDSQLDLENLARDVETSSPAFSNWELLFDSLHRMESYLNKMIGEYEKQRREFDEATALKPIQELPCIADFIRHRSAGKLEFHDEFVVPFHVIQKQIRNDLLHPRLVPSK